jgi:hypothetical protein
MSTFEPTVASVVHDELNDREFDCDPAWAAHFREHARLEGGKVGWDGLILDGWRARAAR